MCAFSYTWDETDLGATAQNAIDDIVENTRRAAGERAGVEHTTYAVEGANLDVWLHRKEAGRVNYGLAANKPAAPTAVGASGRVNGSSYVETDTKTLKYYNGDTAAWETIGTSLHSALTTTYTTGTVTVTNASPTVTGVATAWVAGGITSSDVFKGPDGEYYQIASVDSATQITLGRNYDLAMLFGQSNLNV